MKNVKTNLSLITSKGFKFVSRLVLFYMENQNEKKKIQNSWLLRKLDLLVRRHLTRNETIIVATLDLL